VIRSPAFLAQPDRRSSPPMVRTCVGQPARVSVLTPRPGSLFHGDVLPQLDLEKSRKGQAI
jgi:hypothetical protein